MRINAIIPNFTSANNEQSTPRHDLLDKFHEKARNSADMTDTLLVPRTIFKGYLGIMAGTVFVTLGGVLNKYPRTSKFFTISGLIASLYGTYAFVRPYIIRDTKGVETKPPDKNVTKS